MQTASYSKAMLTVIAIMLAAIACNSYVNPPVSHAEGTAEIQVTSDGHGGLVIFNRTFLMATAYSMRSDGTLSLAHRWRIGDPEKPLTSAGFADAMKDIGKPGKP
jgi:hypothetical protein